MSTLVCFAAMAISGLGLMAQDKIMQRCGTKDPLDVPFGLRDAADCNGDITNPDPMYDPGSTYTVQVVVHVITTAGGTGSISDARIQSQIDILNEDYLALAGTPGAEGFNSEIQFALATTDPQGAPTNGITRTANNAWYNAGPDSPEEQDMKESLGWDESRYCNIYTSAGGGLLGWAYFPFWQGLHTWEDSIVINWQAFGRDSELSPYDQGRTATHEVGHWLGLLHTFQGGCGSAGAPYTTGDLIADTNQESFQRFGCPTGASSCGSLDPIENYMDYTDDACMLWFTQEQARRMRCAIESYRPEYLACGPPSITLQPTGSSECVGVPITLTCTASEGSYQWRKDGSNIDDATGATYNITSPTTADSGSYDCVITNACANVTTNAVDVVVIDVAALLPQWLNPYSILDLVGFQNTCGAPMRIF